MQKGTAARQDVFMGERVSAYLFERHVDVVDVPMTDRTATVASRFFSPAEVEDSILSITDAAGRMLAFIDDIDCRDCTQVSLEAHAATATAPVPLLRDLCQSPAATAFHGPV